MYMSRLSRDEAEDIIVNGQGSGFSQIVLLGNLFTIYHRFYDNEYWDVAEVTYNFIDDYGDEQQSVVFYILPKVSGVVIISAFSSDSELYLYKHSELGDFLI